MSNCCSNDLNETSTMADQQLESAQGRPPIVAGKWKPMGFN